MLVIIEAYTKTIQLTFAQGIVTAFVGLILLLIIWLPKLGNAPVKVAISG